MSPEQEGFPLSRPDVAAALIDACEPGSDDASTDAAVAALADEVAARGLEPGERHLGIHGRVAVRLLEQGCPDAARSVTRHRVARQPLFTMVRDGAVFAWLPGFDDPRVQAPDAAYDISDLVTARAAIDDVRLTGRRLVLGGHAYLRHLEARTDDRVSIVLHHPDGAAERVPARRVRRWDHVSGTGTRLNRLAWSGFAAELDPARLRRDASTVRLQVEIVTRDGLTRTGRLTASGPAGLKGVLPFDLPMGLGRVRFADARGAVTLTTESVVDRTRRRVPAPVRAAVRRSVRLVRR